jgi:ssDNA-binding Zn-finger/Zn-ribbon topoisomerase 1
MKFYTCPKCKTIHNNKINSIAGVAESCPACNYTHNAVASGFFDKDTGNFPSFNLLREAKVKKGIWVA